MNFNKTEDVLNELKLNGFYVLNRFLNYDEVEKLKSSFLFQLKEMPECVWKDIHNSDIRIYGIDRINKDFGSIFETEFLNEIYSKYVSKKRKYSFVMANKTIFKEKNLGSGGGWHRDTFIKKQLKFIVYLTNVEEENGPFEYIPKTHKILHKILDYFTRILKKQKTRYHSVSKNSSKILGQKGDLIIVDTSGIHRGAPIKEGYRIALTFYMNEGRFSPGIENLLVKN